MNRFRSLATVLFTIAMGFALASCGSIQGDRSVQTTGTPVNPFTDPGAANQPSAPLTGAQSQRP